jgi:wobble nucleotide-excising tRNase
MIKKLDIGNFGIFNSYSWSGTIGGDYHFQRVNIIYGRNYSGKTTLSRIFRCIEKGELHKDHSDGNFSLDCHDGCNISHVNITGLSHQDKVRVYNTDFVNENLSWIHSADGTILPFTILGSKNVDIDNKIKDIDKKLGSIDSKEGLVFELFGIAEKLKVKSADLRKNDDSIQNRLKSKANDTIKLDSNLFVATPSKRSYNVNDIQQDIETVQGNITEHIIPSDKKGNKIKFLAEKYKQPIALLPNTRPGFANFHTKTHELLTREIKLTQQINDLVADNLLQEWVRHGIEHHRGKRENCALCGKAITDDLWEKLDAHFSKESKELRTEIDSQIILLEKAKKGINTFLSNDLESLVYTSLHERLQDALKKWEAVAKKYTDNIDYFIERLNSRAQAIFKSQELETVEDISDEIVAVVQEFNDLITENNNKTNVLEKEQTQVRKELRLSEVASFAKDIDFKRRIDEIEQLTLETSILAQSKAKAEESILKLQTKKAQLEASAKDETRGADLVNKHVSDFFGHDELQLVAEGKAPNVKFKILRDGKEAKNMSEGECSLISFCYFIAKIEDEMKDAVKGSQLIIYIDDPISSLDGNHIFFMFSLIESIIAKPKKYGQLFISTHNLDFLKYLKRLTIPDSKQHVSHFLIERRHKQNDKRSFITEMPSHIREYVTEFNYLFGQIYSVYKEVKGNRKAKLENTYNQFYNLPNNIRKFLECYLFYKFPNNSNPLENLPKLFDGTVPTLINRVINEYSHLTYIDRGWKPIDVDEVEECAKIVIDKIQEKDPEQFHALLESIATD